MLKARGRFVNFRVTDDEFVELKAACDRHGAPCLSAFARKVILNTPNASGGDFADKLAALQRRLSVLEVSMSRLVNALAGSSVNVKALEE
jgi:hypothetical protein